ncbi:helix-turn-helix domain-containing protein [Nocardiaceae bacterium NPDC056970]
MSEEEASKTPSMSDDDRFAENMKLLREQRGWSQGEMARQMQRAGWGTFHQTTISRIEKGDRPVRVGEAGAIAEVLGASLGRLIDRPAVVHELTKLSSLLHGLDAVKMDLARAGSGYRALQYELRRALEEAGAGVYERFSAEEQRRFADALSRDASFYLDEPPF